MSDNRDTGNRTLPPNRDDPTSAKSAAPLSAALLWTVGIVLAVAVIAILIVAL